MNVSEKLLMAQARTKAWALGEDILFLDELEWKQKPPKQKFEMKFKCYKCKAPIIKLVINKNYISGKMSCFPCKVKNQKKLNDKFRGLTFKNR